MQDFKVRQSRAQQPVPEPDSGNRDKVGNHCNGKRNKNRAGQNKTHQLFSFKIKEKKL